MAYEGPLPLGVAKGGTGDATITGLVSGNGTAAFVGRTLTGTTNQIAITNGTGVSGNPTVALASNVVNATQPAFLYILGSNVSNVTGDGTIFTVGSGTALTQVFDQGSNMTTGGTFTAPVTGVYYFTFTATLSGTFAVGMTGCVQRIVATGGTYINDINPFAAVSGANLLASTINLLINLTATNTVTFGISVSGGTKVISCAGTNTQQQTFISGYLVC